MQKVGVYATRVTLITIPKSDEMDLQSTSDITRYLKALYPLLHFNPPLHSCGIETPSRSRIAWLINACGVPIAIELRRQVHIAP